MVKMEGVAKGVGVESVEVWQTSGSEITATGGEKWRATLEPYFSVRNRRHHLCLRQS